MPGIIPPSLLDSPLDLVYMAPHKDKWKWEWTWNGWDGGGNENSLILSYYNRLATPHLVWNVKELVDHVVQQCKPNELHPKRLVRSILIIGHGGPGSQHIGAEEIGICDATVSTNNGRRLHRLADYFAPEAHVVLGGCLVGADKGGHQLLLHLSRDCWGKRSDNTRTGVTVQAGVGFQMGGFQGYKGGWVAYRDGKCVFEFRSPIWESQDAAAARMDPNSKPLVSPRPSSARGTIHGRRR